MSQRRKRVSQVQSDDLEDEDYSLPQSQSQSQSHHISSKDQELLAGQVCNLLLVAEMKKIPVKSAAIKKFILKKYKSSFNSVMQKAGEIMEHAFGYKIVHVEGNSYILVSTERENLTEHRCLSESEASVQGVLVSVLIAIFMSEGKISSGSLEAYLNVLDVDITKPAEKAMIQDFLRKKYLETVVEHSSDPPLLLYLWGDRAHAEVSKEALLELVCKIYGNNVKSSMWTYQWNVVQDDRKKNGDAPLQTPVQSRSSP